MDPDVQTDQDLGQHQNVLAGFSHLTEFGENRRITVREMLHIVVCRKLPYLTMHPHPKSDQH